MRSGKFAAMATMAAAFGSPYLPTVRPVEPIWTGRVRGMYAGKVRKLRGVR